MKVEPKNLQEKIIGAEKEMTFEIDSDSHIIFEILRDKMYSDKIGAVTREVASNSRDANREAGREHIPIIIEIVAPNKFTSISHTTIVFHDNGIGITPDRMSDVFIKYASSTKRDSNNETGGFGLGAKTPFAYSDTFTVITVCDWAEPILETKKVQEIITKEQYDEDLANGIAYVLPEGEITVRPREDEVVILVNRTEVIGYEPVKRMKYMYNAIIDSSNKGKMILFESEETDEDTGTKIVVPIKNDVDRDKFEKKAIYATQYWGNKVTYKGFKRQRSEYDTVIDEPEFSVVKKYSDTSYALLIDDIHYPLDKNQVGIEDNGISQEYTILMKFGTGELTISANRESVQYDEHTNQAIKDRQEHIKDRISTLANEYVKTLPSYFDACKFSFYMMAANQNDRRDLTDDLLSVITEAFNGNRGYYHTKKILSDERSRFKDITYDGKELIPFYQFKHHDICLVVEPRYGEKTRYDAFRKLNVTDNLAKYPIYYADTRKDSRRNKTIFENHDSFYLFIPRGGTADDPAQMDEMDDFTSKLDMTFEMYSDVEKKKPDGSTSRGSTSNKERVTLNCKRAKYGELHSKLLLVKRKTFEIDDTTGFGASYDEDHLIYYTVDSLSSFRLHWHINDDIKSLQTVTGKTVIFVNEPTSRNWLSKTKVQSFEAAKKEVEKKYKKRWVERTRMNKIADALEDGMSRQWKFYTPIHEVLTPMMPKCVQEYLKFKKNNPDDLLKKEPFISQEIPFDEEGLTKKIESLFNDRYPMLLPYVESKLAWHPSQTTKERVKANVEKYIKSI